MIEKIKLQNFRCFKELEINLNKKNIIYGLNGSGKTSLVESLYLCSNYRTLSPKTKNNDLIKFNSENAEIFINTKNKLRLSISKNKKIYLDGFESDVLSFVKSIKCVFFLSDEIFIFFSKPSSRRKYFDQLIFNLDSDYLLLVQKYIKILRNRNIQCKKNKVLELDIWTEYLKDINNRISEKKKIYVENLTKEFKKVSNDLLGKKVEFSIEIDKKEYFPGIENKEIENGRTLFGHHLEDYSLYIDGVNLNSYSSNGQKKLFLFLIKLSHLSLSEFYSYNQALIIDDLESELDNITINSILDYLSKINKQVIITNIDKLNISGFNIINLNNYN
ncbi:DNA replication/repair protein RecF [Desulfuromonas acetoxidans]|uniref:DNA replication and repair protein RecF n=1 Tax=Desulfuromonas acetoxidans (strain DSM 684 / 11070) TaxID=281689 RepID=Q1JZF1_DESA6|nr:AAA family ATPase [Desulfuromonas acetoxidans]EAT15616.1 Recombinational DNA repair ATPase (RecF pathway)-like [Desulfuromonas acetoxidans DSM 684]MBF0645757.1 DNA replication/repair protein RecF [Desulfuromonas acetoxidans]NVD25209.1 DNA replication/repair protein RecF [Desulfuromonas acetoxidans]NVE17169.1 DNA replication/repair protein RecF [Desulfuromonas acetoxidans]